MEWMTQPRMPTQEVLLHVKGLIKLIGKEPKIAK